MFMAAEMTPEAARNVLYRECISRRNFLKRNDLPVASWHDDGYIAGMSYTAFEGLGKALRWIRDKQGKKQYQVADTAGITKAMLSAYETDKQKPSIETLEKIMTALAIDLADLFHALQVVNEVPRSARRDGLAGQDRGGFAATDPRPDVYAVLGLERPLATLEEEALAQMLAGFHQLLRHFHHELAAARLALKVEEPAADA